jgi:glycosyltransferase involved in cell wall biosynthesis
MKWTFGWPRRVTTIYQITDKGQWALYWVAYFVTQGLRERHAAKVEVVREIGDTRGQILHYIDRYAYLRGKADLTHPSNHVFLTWYHSDPHPENRWLFEALPKALPRLRGVVTSCQATRQSLLGLGVPDEKIHILPIGVDLRTFRPPSPFERQAARAQFGVPANAFCVGSFQKDGTGWEEGMEAKLIKGPDVFLEALALAKNRLPRLFVFLTGQARGYVKRGLEKLGIPYVHHALDEYHNIIACYHALDAYLIASRIEGGPKGMMESWATGVPVVSTRMGMPADYMRHEENGLLAEVEDGEGLAEGLLRLAEDAALRQTCIKNALEAVRPLGWDVIADGYYALYRPYLRG